MVHVFYFLNSNCETALINLTECWKRAKDNKQSTGIISTVMCKALNSLHPAFPGGFYRSNMRLPLRQSQQDKDGISDMLFEKSQLRVSPRLGIGTAVGEHISK